MALYILGVFLLVLVLTALMLHYGFYALDMLPSAEAVTQVKDRHFFKMDYGFYLNLLFLSLSGVCLWSKLQHTEISLNFAKSKLTDKLLIIFSGISYTWLAGGALLAFA